MLSEYPYTQKAAFQWNSNPALNIPVQINWLG